jgi:hypothetical protein
MGKLTKIIRKTILKEVAGISFEVREWAKIIERRVGEEIEKARKEQKTTKSSEPSEPSEPIERDLDPGLPFTHFEYDEDDGPAGVTDTAYIYGDDLYVHPDISEDFPGIERDLSGKLFKVVLSDDGHFDVTPARGSQISNYDNLEGIKELVEDHALNDGMFYDLSYRALFASQEDDDNSYLSWDYYNQGQEENRWANLYSWVNRPSIDKIEIDGTEHPEVYEKFKVDKWVITNSGRIEYDHWKSGYDEDGKYVVYLNMPMSSVGGSALVHEIKHAYDDWNRISKGYPAIRDSWEIKNIYTKDFEKLVLGGSYKLSPMLHPIIRYYYLGSKLESPAYIENVYDYSGLGGDYRETAKKIMNFKASNFLNKKGQPAKGLQESWEKLIKEYDIPLFRRFPNVVDFLNYTEKYFNKRGRDIIKRIDKMRYVHKRFPPKRTYTPSKGGGRTNISSNTDDLPF